MNRSESDDEASFESILDDLQQFEEEEQSGRAQKQGARDLLSDAEGSVASEAGAVMPIVELVFSLRKAHSCAAIHQSCLGVAKGPSANQNANTQAWQLLSITCRRTHNWRSRKKDKRVKQPVTCLFRPEVINP
jgi:hypothetical protein